MPQTYDATVKLLFRQSRGILMKQLFGAPVSEWLNVELPRVENPRVDLLARCENGALVHLELQSYNDLSMGRREVEYYLGLYRLFDRHVEQVVLYVGKQPMRMEPVWRTPAVAFQFRLIDIRDLDGEPLIESDDLGDNMLALLTRAHQERVVERVLERIAKLEGKERETAALMFMIISGLRDVEEKVLERTRSYMPILIDIMENKVLGPAYRKGIEEGIEKGMEKGVAKGIEQGIETGIEKGVRKGEALLLQTLLEDRFGPLPQSVVQRLAEASKEELVHWGKRMSRVAHLEEVFA